MQSFRLQSSLLLVYTSPMRDIQRSVYPNFVDLFVVLATCFVVLFLIFPLHAGEQPCKSEVVEASGRVVEGDCNDSSEPVVKKTAVASSDKKQVADQKDQAQSEHHKEAIAAVDIEVLTERLKNSDAIGMFTKLAIRNDIVDIIDQIEEYREKELLNEKIGEIRASFDGLLLKIVALLEEDPVLSRDLYVSRESIWNSLLEVKV